MGGRSQAWFVDSAHGDGDAQAAGEARSRIFQGCVFGHNLLRGITQVVVDYEHLRLPRPSRALGFHGVEQQAKLIATIANRHQNTDPHFDLLREIELTLLASNYPYPRRIELLL
jgi:hypothetical protein